MSLVRGKIGDTIIAFSGDKNDYVAVKESPEELLGPRPAGAKSCPCDSATAEHHHAN
jgi:hypothetical protein